MESSVGRVTKSGSAAWQAGASRSSSTWEVTLARPLISDDEWVCLEGFIRAVRHPNGRKPADHRRVLDGIFWSEA